MTKDEQYMLRCLELASNGICSVAPNPMVGAVIVKDDQIIGEGYHQRFGEAHAEVNAINSVTNKQSLRNSTMYINLEPCIHFGKTPPCAELIKEVGIPRVIVATSDPNPMVNGKGINFLRQSGCQVLTGVLEKEANELNHRFFHFHRKGRPYFILKWAETEDGFIDKIRNTADPLQPNWITDDICRMLVHRWRTEEQAVMIGTNTALLDNPQLNSRYWPGNQPIKLILDRDLKIPLNFELFTHSAPLYIFNSRANKDEGFSHYQKIDFGRLLDELIIFLSNKGIQSVMIEGGSKLIQSFIDKGIWDEARIFTGPILFGKGVKAPAISGNCIFDDEISNSRLRILRP
jgi:diaminohydroxyphosphoribosylaminopyrimidine deaminase / 5-amino-6-(5-phosphoribosylamino)uracil reductase